MSVQKKRRIEAKTPRKPRASTVAKAIAALAPRAGGNVPILTKPKILFVDIETFAIIGDVWGFWEQNLLRVRRWPVICGFSAKWLGGAHITKALPDYEGYTPGDTDDAKLVYELWELFNEADIIIAHNGDDFDVKKVHARFLKHGLAPPSPFKTVDTKKVAKKLFRFDSNRLNDICAYLGIGKKLSTGGYELWQQCEEGNKAAWKKMKKYNKHDVLLLIEVYLRFLPWINNHPNLGLYSANGCPKCGSQELQSRGVAKTTSSTYQRYQCQSCGGWSRSTKSVSKTGVVNIA